MIPTTLVYNAIRTPDGTLLVSRHRHDYVVHDDRVSGEQYMLDGGIDYIRTSLNRVPATDESVTLDDGIGRVREVLEWGTRGRDGREPLRQILLKDMTNAHIQACLDTQPCMHTTYRKAFEMELKFRREYEITITDV